MYAKCSLGPDVAGLYPSLLISTHFFSSEEGLIIPGVMRPAQQRYVTKTTLRPRNVYEDEM